jgi:putative hydrolase of the HAD superfamily
MRDRLIIFDGDDTLWETMPLYTEAKHRFYVAMAEQGFDSRDVAEDFEKIDLNNMERFGFGRLRFPTSMVDTYRLLSHRFGRRLNEALEAKFWGIGDAVFTKRPRVFPEAHEVLGAIKRSSSLVLLTKGEQSVQRERVAQSGLEEFFVAVYVVAEKGRSELDRVLNDVGIEPSASWSIGNSLKADINPALNMGMSAIWIPYHTWDAEVDIVMESPLLFKVHSLINCLDVLGLPRQRDDLPLHVGRERQIQD